MMAVALASLFIAMAVGAYKEMNLNAPAGTVMLAAIVDIIAWVAIAVAITGCP